MSRPLLSTLRLASTSRAGVRGLLTGAAGTKSSSRPTGAIGGVDPRIFSGNGVEGFIGATEVARVNEWQAGLWERLQAEVRSE